jgi:Tfp pilus assembly protein PilO
MTKPARHNTWIVTVSLASMAIAFMALVWLPGRRNVKELCVQVETKRGIVAQATGLGTMLIGVNQELSKSEAIVTQWEKTAPGKREIPELFGKIDALAKSAHLAIGRFDPQPVVVHERLREIPITMNCSGTFGQIFAFLHEIERLPATIWVESLRIEKTAQNAKDVQCELNLVVFSNKSQGSDYARHSD